jgi:N-acetylmuramoyl-L-alanine amidase
VIPLTPSLSYFKSMRLCALILMLCLSSSAWAGEASPILSHAVTLTSTSEATRLVFDVSAPLDATSYILANPDRIIIDVPEVHFLMPQSQRSQSLKKQGAHAQKSNDLIASYRFGSFAQGRSRIVIDLLNPAQIRHIGSEPRDGGYQFVIELAPTDRVHFKIEAEKGRQLLSMAAPSHTAPISQSVTQPRPVVVIDPGHGGIDTGAQSAGGINEKDIVFAFAKRLANRLETSGKYRVVMTRSSDVFVPLNERVHIARAANASLFISIHADTLSDDQGVTGATVYTVSDRASDAEAARIAEKENQADLAGGLDRREDQGEVNDILFDLTRRETRSYSHALAQNLVDVFGKIGNLNKNPHRSAGFVVLKAPDVPSVLLELGYLSSAKDISNLTKPEWRDQASFAVAGAIDRFISARILQNAPENSPNSLIMGLGQERAHE